MEFPRIFIYRNEFDICVEKVNNGYLENSLAKLLCFCAYDAAFQSGDMFDVEQVFSQAIVAAGNATGAKSIIRGYFIDQFEQDVIFPDDNSQYLSTGNGDMLFTEGQNIGSRIVGVFWTAFQAGCRAMKDATTMGVDAAWAIAKKAFEMALGSHFQTLVKAAHWIVDIWDRMKTWCQQIITESARWMAGFEECLVYGLGIIGIAAVLVLVEKFMIGSCILGGPIGLAQTFVLCFVSYIGLREGGKAVSRSCTAQLSSLVTSCQAVVDAIARSMSADGTIGASGQSNPIILLETFASGLGTVSADGLIQTGRLFNACSQIKSGGSAIWSCVTKITDFLWDLLDKGFGLKSRALADLSVLMGQDVQGWLRRCDAACEYMCIYPAVPQHVLKNFKMLKCVGMQIRTALLSRPERGSTMALNSVNKALEKLNDLLMSAILAGSNGPRFEPLWVAFVGKPGVGKSTAVNSFVARYLRDNNLDETDYYARNTADTYWSGYRRQAVVTYDDLGALSGNAGISEEGELIKLVSRDALPLNMAGIEEKGMYFDSALILTSSNFISYSPHAQIHDPVAYLRRRSLVVDIQWKDGYELDPDHPLAHQRYVLRNKMEPFNVLEEFETFEDFYAFFLDIKNKHEEVQTKIMATMKHEIASTETRVVAATTLLAMLHGIVPISVMEFIKDYHLGYQFLTYFDGKLYLINENFELKITTNLEGIDKEDLIRLREQALTLACRYTNLLKSFPTLDPMACHFLADLVQKRVFTDQMEVRKGLEVEDDQLFEVAVAIPKWQRAFIYVLSASLVYKNKGFFLQVYDDMCDSLQRAYCTDVASWPMALKIGLGVVGFLVFGKTVLWALQRLGSFGSGAALAVAATQTFSHGQSDDEVRKNTAEYRHRNSPVRVRHWSYAQNDGISFEWLMKHSLATFRWAHLDCQVLVLPGKRLVGVNHFLRKIPDGVIVQIVMDDQQYHICWHANNLELLEKSELAVYKHSTLRDVHSGMLDRVCFSMEELPDTFPAVMCSCKWDDITQEYVSEYANIVVKKRNVVLNICSGEYSRIVPTCLEYKANTINKDCGSLIVAQVNGIARLVGLHVAGIAGTGQACVLPPELKVSRGQNSFEHDFKSFANPTSVGDGTVIVGVLHEDKKFHTQQKTSYQQTPEAWHLDFTCDKEPAILSKHDERLVGTCHSDYDPYIKGMEKYKDAAGPFEEDALELASDQIVETWKDVAGDFSFEECSVTEAINGIQNVEYCDPLVMNTSEGYPFLLSRDGDKGKTRFFVESEGRLVPNEELAKRIDSLERICAEQVPELVGVECAKDEKLPLRKIYDEPKTRLFTVLPMDYNIVVRMKFFRFVVFLMSCRDNLPCQVGINPYSREWGRLASTLLEKGDNILCCDYSRFDGILPKQVMYVIGQMINKLMGGSQRLQAQRSNLLMAAVGRYAICAGKVWRVENGIPSGFPLTVILNSVFNEVIIRYLYIVIFRNDRLMRSSFCRYVAFVTYGDDNLISVSATIHSKFNGDVIQKMAADLGIKITDGVDKTLPSLNFRKLEECDFLKRKFKRTERGLWCGPMEKESLWSQLHWVKTKFLGMNEAFLVNAEAVLRELYLHDPHLCKMVRAKLLRIDWIEPQMLPAVEQIAAFHDMQMGDTRIKAYAYDAIMSPILLGPIGAVGKEISSFEFKGLLATKSGHYKYAQDDFVFCLNVASQYGDNGMFITWALTSGRGELPTADWLRQHLINKKSNLYIRMKRLIKSGKRLVFLARNNNVYSTIFLVIVGFEHGLITVAESNQILSKAIEQVGSLGYLTEMFPEYFHSINRAKAVHCGPRRIFRMIGVSRAQVDLLRRADVATTYELSPVRVPIFQHEWKDYVEFVRDKESSGIIVLFDLKVKELAGMPGLLVKDWITQGGGRFTDAELIVVAIYFDSNVMYVETETICCDTGKGLTFSSVIKFRTQDDSYCYENVVKRVVARVNVVT